MATGERTMVRTVAKTNNTSLTILTKRHCERIILNSVASYSFRKMSIAKFNRTNKEAILNFDREFGGKQTEIPVLK